MAFGAASLSLLYCIGCLVYGPTAGFVAMLCLAVSPVHIWYSQALRPYALVVLLALVSMYAFLRALRNGAPGWAALCFAANLLLVWTHYLQIFLVLTEGLCVCLFVLCSRSRLRAALCWSVLHVLVLIPWALYVLSISPSNLGHVASLHIDDVLTNLTGSGAPGLVPDYVLWLSSIPMALHPYLTAMHNGLDAVLGVVFAGAIVWLAVTTLGSALRRREDMRDSTGRGKGLADAVFLLLLITLPVTVLALLTYLSGRPFLLSRYTLYAGAARYVVLGGILGSLHSRALRRISLCALALPFAYQLAVFLPNTTRTDWLSAIAFIEEKASSEDVIVTGSSFEGQLMLFNAEGNLPVPVLSARNFQAACDASNYFLALDGPGRAAWDESGAVWLVYNQNWTCDPPYALEEKLASCGLSFSLTPLWGWENIAVYRVTRRPARVASLASADTRPRAGADDDTAPDSLLAELGLSQLEYYKRDWYSQLLRRLTPDPSPYDIVMAGKLMGRMDLLRIGELELAGAIARLEMGEDEDVLGRLARGDTEGAMRAYEKTFESVGPAFRLLGPVVLALCRDENDVAYAEIKRLEEMGFAFAAPFREFCRQQTDPPSHRLPFGLLPAMEKCRTAVLHKIERPKWREIKNPNALINLGEVLEMQGRPNEAIVFYEKAVDAGPAGAYAKTKLDAARKRLSRVDAGPNSRAGHRDSGRF